MNEPIVVEMPGKCPKCGSRILKRTSKKGYVFYACERGPDCGFITWDVPTKGICPECGKKFPLNDKGRHRRFCSAECREEYYRKQKDRSAWPSARTAVCPQCGKEFTATREQKHKRVYCSHRCAAIAWRKRERAAALRQADGAGVKKEGQDDCDQT